MRIALVHNRYRSNMPSGENRVVDTEATALTAAGHEVIRFEKQNDDIDGWSRAKKATLPTRIFWSRETYRELSATLRAHHPDVVHVHNTFPLLSPAVILRACQAAAIPVVVTLHNYRLVCASGTFFRDGAICHDCARGLPLPAVRHGCYQDSRVVSAPAALAVSAHRPAWKSLVSAYIFISAAQRDLLGGLGLPPDRVFVRHHLIPRRAVPEVAREPAVLYAGRLAEAKGVRLLMAAWDEYRSSAAGSSLRLVIAGAGPLLDEVAAWAATRPDVELAGEVAASRCAELMAAARAIIVPSMWQETFGLVVVEAMAVGTPAIAAGHGSLAELISDGVDGVLFRPGDPAALAAALADVAARPEKYQDYGDQARKAYEQRFDPQRTLDHLLEIYRFAIAHPARHITGLRAWQTPS